MTKITSASFYKRKAMSCFCVSENPFLPTDKACGSVLHQIPFIIKCLIGIAWALSLLCIPSILCHATDPFVIEYSTLPLPTPTRYSKNPAIYPMPLPKAGDICISSSGNSGTCYPVILFADGTVRAYNLNNADMSAQYPGLTGTNGLAERAKQKGLAIARIAAGATQNTKRFVAAILTDGSVICTDNCTNKAEIESTWTDMVDISAGCWGASGGALLGLRRDGTVLSTNASLNKSMSGIVKISLGDTNYTDRLWAAGLTYDGKIKTAGTGAPAVANTYNFVDIAACGGVSGNEAIAAIYEQNGVYSHYMSNGAIISGVTDAYAVQAADASLILLRQNGTAYRHGYQFTRSANNLIGACGIVGSGGDTGVLGGGALTISANGSVSWVSNSNSSSAANMIQLELSPIRATYYSGSYDKILHNHLWAERETYAIYYTTDGSDPQTSATRKLYSGTEAAPGITISSASTLRAAAYDTAASKFVGGVLTLDYTFTYPTITPSAAPGYFVDPFRLTAEAGGYPIHYTTANRDAALSDPVLGSSGIAISDTTTIHMAIEFGGYAVSQAAFTYTKTETGLIVDNDRFTLTTDPSGTIQASVPVEKVIAGNLPVILVVSVDHGQANVCRKVEFITVSQAQQTLTATLTPPVDIPAGATTKAYLLQSFASMRPISKVVIKK